MINNRILELLQQPQLIVPEDLSLLEKQIKKEPYMQNVRALYLYGIHQYLPQRYKEVLTTTAAYTTDKKILYQFINQKEIQSALAEKQTENVNLAEEIQVKENVSENRVVPIIEGVKKEEVIAHETAVEEVIKEEDQPLSTDETSESVEDIKPEISEDKEPIKYGEVSSEEVIDNAAAIDENNTVSISPEEDLNFSKDVIIDKDNTETESKELAVDISFESIDEFLPNVKFSVPKNHHTFLNPPKYQKSQEPVVADVLAKSDVNFKTINHNKEEELDVTDFNHIVNFGPSDQVESPIDSIEKETTTVEPTDSIESPSIEEVKVVEAVWTPMSFDNNLPDALIGKSESQEINTQSKVEEVAVAAILNEDKEAIIETEIHEEIIVEEARPIMNVSFFSEAMSIVKEEEKIADVNTEENNKTEVIKPGQSNISKFINTWQSWLKIDRTDEIEKEKEIIKNKVIEEFIEKQPKISQLKEEVNFVVKEKKEDISHLMTETFANLYLEQKLYTKAINAFEILIKKHPEKEAYFLERINEIKDIRKPF